MKRFLPVLLCGTALAFHPVSAADFSPWQYQQKIKVTVPGLQRLALPVETLGASRSQLEDLRLLSPTAGETSFAIQHGRPVPARVVPAKNFQVHLGDQSTVIDVETGTGDAITALLLESPTPNFVKSAFVEGSNDDQQWNRLADAELLFRQANGAGRLRIPLASASWKKLRVTLGDQRSPPVPFTVARLELAVPQQPAIAQHHFGLTTESLPRTTRLTVRLGASHLQLAGVKFECADQVFSRRVRASYFQTGNGPPQEIAVTSGVIYRVMAGNHPVTSLEIPIQAQINADELVLTIENEDSPPLQKIHVAFTRLPVSLVFFAQEAGDWRLLTGNRTTQAPTYDIDALHSKLSQIEASALVPGVLEPNPAYKEPDPLHGVTPEGAGLDLSPWHYRKAVADVRPGVWRVELDAEMLAHAQVSLGDLRVIQNEKQIPFLIDHHLPSPTLMPVVASDPDPKRPSVSRWRLTLPLEGLPVQRLLCSSPTPLFERTLEVFANTRDSRGGTYRMSLGSRNWIRNTGAAPSEFSLPLSSVRIVKEFFIEVENGDNSPIALESVRIEYPGVAVVAKISHAGPVFLYYGNEETRAPRYDLLLARQELLSAPVIKASLGPEEKLRAESRRAAGLSAGSPWLWASLALVLVVLLWIVAKMLPAAGPAQK